MMKKQNQILWIISSSLAVLVVLLTLSILHFVFFSLFSADNTANHTLLQDILKNMSLT